VKEPAIDPVHDRVEVPEAVEVVKTILDGERVHINPVEGETVVERLTVPVNPLTAVTVIVDVPGEPTAMLTLVGLAAMEKSWAAVTVNVTVAEWDRDPLVPVTATEKTPAVDPVHDRVEDPEVPSVTLVGLRVHVRPVEGEIVSVNATVPVKPLSAETAIVEVPVEPTVKLTLVGVAVTVKSWARLTV
jgi:hypothetical protein